MLAADPEARLATLAKATGVSRQRVQQIAVSLGYPPRNKRRSRDHKSEYGAWRALIQRCTNPNDLSWRNYGGRGIRVCDRWLRSFDSFIADMGPRPSSAHSIDRIDNDGGYEPYNCRWATDAEQRANTRRSIKKRERLATKAAAGPGKSGRPPKVSAETAAAIQEMRNAGASIAKVSKHFDLDPGTIQRWSKTPETWRDGQKERAAAASAAAVASRKASKIVSDWTSATYAAKRKAMLPHWRNLDHKSDDAAREALADPDLQSLSTASLRRIFGPRRDGRLHYGGRPASKTEER